MWSIADQSVHLWWTDCRSLTPAASWAADYLSATEQQEWQRKVPPLRERSLLAKVFLKSVLAQYVDKAPLDLCFRFNDFGKPSLVDEDLAFNLSHSGDYLVLALRAKGNVGIDLQKLGATRQPLAVAARFFHDSEHQWLHALPEVWQEHYFYRLWAAKEAVLKAAGIGIGATGLKDIVFSAPVNVEELVSLSIDRDCSSACLADFQVQEFFWLSDAVLSLASCQTHTDLQTFLWQSKLTA